MINLKDLQELINNFKYVVVQQFDEEQFQKLYYSNQKGNADGMYSTGHRARMWVDGRERKFK